MSHGYQFLAALPTVAAPNPTILLDLDDEHPFTVQASSSVSPPKVRYVTAGRVSQAGEDITLATHDDREIRLDLKMVRSTAEEQAAAIQKLARIITKGGVWLKWQSEDITKPLFFLTKQADLAIVDDVLDASPLRDLSLTIPAEPYGFGLPETGQFTITNNPAAGTNKMMTVLPPIKGDVLTPLHLSFPTPDADHKISWASESVLDSSTDDPTAPFWVSLSAVPIKAAAGPWTLTDTADSTMVSGTRRRLVKASTTDPDLMVPTIAVMQQWNNLPAGDYRVFVRVAGVNAGMRFLFWNRPPSTGSALVEAEAALSMTVPTSASAETKHDWFDMGVVAMPGGAPLADRTFGLDGPDDPALWNFGVVVETAQQLDLDSIVLVPAGRRGTITRHGSVSFPATYTSKIVTVDGLNGRRFARGRSLNAIEVLTVVPASDVAGGTPVVVPGADNSLFFMATLADASATRVDDDKALTTVIDYTYFPRYLSADRPGTS